MYVGMCMNTLVTSLAEKYSVGPDIQVYHSQEIQQASKTINTIKK